MLGGHQEGVLLKVEDVGRAPCLMSVGIAV